MKKFSFLLVVVSTLLMGFKTVDFNGKEWEEIGTAGGVHFSWRCLSKTSGELKLKNTQEHALFASGGFEIYDLEKSIVSGDFQFDTINPQEEKVTVFSDAELQRLDFVTGIRLKKT